MADEPEALDRALDALLANAQVAPGTIGTEDAAMLGRLYAGWQRPAPDPTFVHRLGVDLSARAAATAALPQAARVPPASTRPPQRAAGGTSDTWELPRSAPNRRLALAGLAICAVFITLALVDRGDDARRTIPAGGAASPPPSTQAVLLLLDVSGSMSYDPLGGEARLDRAKETARAVVDALPDGTVFGLLAFNDRQTWAVTLAPLSGEAERERARQAIDALVAEGGTELYPAVALGLEALQSQSAPDRQMVILSDGRSRTGTPDDYYALVAPAADDVTIHAAWTADDLDSTVLTVVTVTSDGQLAAVADFDQLPAAVLNLLGILSATPTSGWYGYAPAEQPFAGTPTSTPGPQAPAPLGDVRSTPIEIQIAVDGDGLLADEPAAEAATTDQLEAALAPLAEASCRIGFVITEATAPDIAAGNRIADAVNALLQREFPELTGGAGFYSFANIGEPTGSVVLLVFPNADCDVA